MLTSTQKPTSNPLDYNRRKAFWTAHLLWNSEKPPLYHFPSQSVECGIPQFSFMCHSVSNSGMTKVVKEETAFDPPFGCSPPPSNETAVHPPVLAPGISISACLANWHPKNWRTSLPYNRTMENRVPNKLPCLSALRRSTVVCVVWPYVQAGLE